MSKSHKLVGVVAVLLGVLYVCWIIPEVEHPLGWVIVSADMSFMSIAALYLINHWSQSHLFGAEAPPDGTLDVFLPVVDEPLSMFATTLRAALHIEYEPKAIYVLDDGNRAEIRQLARRHLVHYLARGTNLDFKAGNLNYGFKHSCGDFVLVLDADQVVVDAAIAGELLGYFANGPRVGLVAARQLYDVPDGNFNHDFPFYAHMQPGKNSDNAAISCGSGVIYRRSVLEAIGGFQTWNLVEDLYTSYVMHQRGFVSVYVNKSYTIGTAPLDLRGIYKQRGTWALDGLRIFVKRNPLVTRGLTVRQRLHYFEIAYHYLVPALVLPIVFVISPIILLTDIQPFSNPHVYLGLRFSSLVVQTFFMYLQAEKNLSSTQMWVSLFPVFLKAVALALIPWRPRYRVTDKTARAWGSICLVFPQLLVVAVSLFALEWHILFGKRDVSSTALIGVLWTMMTLFWFAPLFRPYLQSEHALDLPAGTESDGNEFRAPVEPPTAANRAEPRRSAIGFARRLRSDGCLQIVAAAILIGAALRFATIGLQSYWYDEAVTVRLVHSSLSKMLDALPSSESTPPLYYIAAWIWGRVWGTDEAALRSLSALIGTLTIPVAYLAGKELVSRRAGALAAALTAFSPFLIWYSQEARAYSLLALLSALSVLFCARVVNRGSGRDLSLWAIASSLAIWTHYFAIFLIAAEAILLVRQHASRRYARVPGLLLAFAVATVIPLAYRQAHNGSNTWIGQIAPHNRAYTAATWFVVGPDFISHVWWIAGAIGVIGVTSVSAISTRTERRGAAFAVFLAAACIFGSLLTKAAGHDYWLFRNLIPAWIPLAIALSAGLATCRPTHPYLRLTLIALSAASISLTSMNSVRLISGDLYKRDDWRGLAHCLGSTRAGRALIVFPSFQETPLQLYRPQVHQLEASGRQITELDLVGSRPPTFHQPHGFRLAGESCSGTMPVLRYLTQKPLLIQPQEVIRRATPGSETATVLVEGREEAISARQTAGALGRNRPAP